MILKVNSGMHLLIKIWAINLTGSPRKTLLEIERNFQSKTLKKIILYQLTINYCPSHVNGVTA